MRTEIALSNLLQLPAPDMIERAFQSAAVIEAAQCDGSRLSRYVRTFQFVRDWRPPVRLGYMDNTQGDFFSMLFCEAGVGVRGVVKEVYRQCRAARDLADEVSREVSPIPDTIRTLMDEPEAAKVPRYTTFCLWRPQSGSWWIPEAIRREPELLEQVVPNMEVLLGDADVYADWAVDALGWPLPRQAIKAVFDWVPLDRALATDLGAQRSFEEVARDAEAIGYPLA